MGKLIYLNNLTRLDLPVERVCDMARDNLAGGGVIILGYDKEGKEYFASSYADGGNVLWLLERCKKKLLEVPELP